MKCCGFIIIFLPLVDLPTNEGVQLELGALFDWARGGELTYKFGVQDNPTTEHEDLNTKDNSKRDYSEHIMIETTNNNNIYYDISEVNIPLVAEDETVTKKRKKTKTTEPTPKFNTPLIQHSTHRKKTSHTTKHHSKKTSHSNEHHSKKPSRSSEHHSKKTSHASEHHSKKTPHSSEHHSRKISHIHHHSKKTSDSPENTTKKTSYAREHHSHKKNNVSDIQTQATIKHHDDKKHHTTKPQKNQKNHSQNHHTTKSNQLLTNITTKKKIDMQRLIKNGSSFYDTPHYIRDHSQLKEFPVHLYREALKLIDAIATNLTSVEPSKITSLYKAKFLEFVNDTQYLRVRTRLGNEKVILNILETSNRLIRKVVNHFIEKIKDSNVLRKEEKSIAKALTKMIEKHEDKEYNHICSKFGICRTGYTFTTFLGDILSSILRNDDKRLKIVIETLTEAAKNTDFTFLLTYDNNKELYSAIDRMETWEPQELRHTVMTLKNHVMLRNQPLRISGQMQFQEFNKTLALCEIINTLNDIIDNNEENLKDMKDIYRSVIDYQKGLRDDIDEIMNVFLRYIISKGLEHANPHATNIINNKIKILLAPIEL